MKFRDASITVQALVVVAAIGLFHLFNLYGEFLWFLSVGYSQIFKLTLLYQVGLFFAFAIPTYLVLYVSDRWAAKKIDTEQEGWLKATMLFLAVLVGVIYSTQWKTVLEFIHGVPFGTVDPIFSKDLAFYLFNIPFYHLVTNYAVALTLLALGLTVARYSTEYSYERKKTEVDELLEKEGSVKTFNPYSMVEKLKENSRGHITVLIAAVLLSLSTFFWLSRYDLLFSGGTVYGMGHTDKLVHLPVRTTLSLVALVGAAVALVNIKVEKNYIFRGIAVTLVGVALLGAGAAWTVQTVSVEPDEFNKEKKYLENEIKFTRQGFALNRIRERQFPVSQNISRRDIESNPETINNIRLWDSRPLLTTYNELQIFRTYYTFTDVDVDRYKLNGETREMMTSPRELDFQALPQESQTWVNRHLVYTHGYGLTMSPVTNVSKEGLPELTVKDIPPKSKSLNIKQPRLYFGEETDSFVVTGTGTRELDYPAGNQNVYTEYAGEDGISLNTFRRFIYSLSLRSPNLFFSQSIQKDSRLHIHRDITERVKTIAPFLEFDKDPYIVAADGKLYWIYDAYTTSSSYPYSRPSKHDGRDVNYIRNSVKVVIDAYDGTTTFYMAEKEPIVQTYSKIFPGMFQSMSEMPESIREHVRYPQDIFDLQSDKYRDYHMRDPQVFYNKEDRWNKPREVFRGNTRPMEPYYIMMKLPGEEKAEFIQIMPFVPEGKQNMIGWLAARSDRPNYGKLQAFLFSKQELVFGPMQIESRIDQNTNISQQITLWSQSGSEVLRGNLLAIPIEDTVIYVEPLFLKSREEGALPELKRVIVAHNDRVVMESTLNRALAALLKEDFKAKVKAVRGEVSPDKLAEARRLYREAQEALENGDFETWGEKWRELGRVLDVSGQE